ncbi:putative membrane protein [Methanomicrobium sp. W14]|uniref:hypothetical protein n=1 Tax=Methanomicrobium sp. W14 TaxID=2817839 RepID=UPI001AE2B07B|nr:hypothetical protein [Methanomicrobium sp. W14]MBP2132341.1 putative membrane protein [Methanomicrobium sp. W14]
MKKSIIKVLLLISALLCVISTALSLEGVIAGWTAAAAVVVSFPVFVLSLGLLLKASDKEGDFPFIGY